MELYVRSQNREDLAKIDYLFVAENKNYLMGYSKGIKIYLGEYKTRERALEVLDEIQNILMPKIIVRTDKTNLDKLEIEYTIREVESFQYDIEKLDTYVYEIPKE